MLSYIDYTELYHQGRRKQLEQPKQQKLFLYFTITKQGGCVRLATILKAKKKGIITTANGINRNVYLEAVCGIKMHAKRNLK